MSEQELGILQQRRIEANIIKPLVRAFEAELGKEKTEQIVAQVIIELAQQKGAELRESTPNDSLKSFAATWEPWLKDNALEIDLLEQSETAWHFNVTRCRYAEMYTELGLAELGYTLSCNRDASLIEGFSDSISLTRTQTIMQGAPHCNFRYNKVTKDD